MWFQEEEAKIQADILLKEVLRKKHDAKKSIAKLEALLKLRKARQNTARGRGQDVSDTEATAFQNNIGKTIMSISSLLVLRPGINFCATNFKTHLLTKLQRYVSAYQTYTPFILKMVYRACIYQRARSLAPSSKDF